MFASIIRLAESKPAPLHSLGTDAIALRRPARS